MSKSTNITSKPKWDWTQVDCNLKFEIAKKPVTWALAPSIVLTNPLGDGPDPTVKLFVDTEKSLQYNEDSQWNWHKSWNLPNIALRAEVKDSSSGEALLAPKNLFAQLFAVKGVPEPQDKLDTSHLVDVGIRGSAKVEMEDGQAFFTAMKFSSTSYNHEGAKFYLLLVLYINNGVDASKVLTSILSPPIFVDSRKSARDNHQKKNESFIEPFLVENLQREFIKRENKKKNENEIKIKNDFEGLFNYLTAPNIRHKVKHPLFIAIKFSHCARLLFNTKQLSPGITLNELINSLQRKIAKDHYSRHQNKNQAKPEDKMFILQVMAESDNSRSKKIAESIDALECNSLAIIYGNNPLPSFFENFSSLGNMGTVYKEEFSQLFITTRSIFDVDLSEEEEEEEPFSEAERKEAEEDKSESEKESSYPSYNIENKKKISISGPEKKVQHLEQPGVVPSPKVVESQAKKSFTEMTPKNIQSPIKIQSQPATYSETPRQTTPRLPQIPVVNYGIALPSPPQPSQAENTPNYLRNMSMEQLYMNNLMISNAMNNLKMAGDNIYSSPMNPMVNNWYNMYTTMQRANPNPTQLPSHPMEYNDTHDQFNNTEANPMHRNQYNMDIHDMMNHSLHQGPRIVENPEYMIDPMGYHPNTGNSPSPKVGFSPTVPPESQLPPMLNLNLQYMMQQNKLLKELTTQTRKNEQRGMAPTQGYSGMSQMGQQIGPHMSQFLGMGQQMGMPMAPFMYLPEGGFPFNKEENK